MRGGVNVSSRDEGLTESQWSKPRVFIKNDGTEPLQLFKMRYYFMVESGMDARIEVWDPSNLSAMIVQEQTGQAYAEIDFAGQTTLKPGESLRWGNGILFGLHYLDWSTFDKSNDWSAVTVNSGSVTNTHVTLLDAFGNLVAGQAPTSMSYSGVASSSSAMIPVANQQIPECWTRYGLLAALDLTLGDRSVVKGGSIHANRNVGLGYDAAVDSNVEAHGNITVRDRARVGKDLLATGTLIRGYSTIIGGKIVQSASELATCNVSSDSLSAGIGGNDIAVASGQIYALVAGGYGNLQVKSNGVLALDSGDYYLTSLSLAPDAKIQLAPGSGNVRVWVSGSFDFGDRSKVIFVGDSLPLRLQVVSLGASPVRIGYDAVLFGLFAAPQADFSYNARASVVGTVVGKSIQVDSDSKLQYVSRVVGSNSPPIVTTGAVSALFGSETGLGLGALQITDVDTPNDMLVVTVAIPPLHGTINVDGIALAAGGKFTMQAFLQGRVTYRHDGSIHLEDQVVIQVFDGLTVVPATILFHVQQPPTPDVHILYPLADSQVDSSQTSVIWTVNGQAKADSASLAWGDNSILRSFTDYWGRTGSDQVVVHHPNRVKIVFPANGATVDGYATTVRWQVDGTNQTYDTTEVLAKGINKIFRRAVKNGVLAGIDTITITSLGIVKAPVVPAPAQTHQTMPSHYVTALTKGENAVQLDIADSAIQDRRAAFVRGRVIGTDSMPLAGAVVRIQDQPEVGYTVTGEDGQYVIVVNGGGVTLDFEKKGYLSLQRPAIVGWNKWARLDDVVLTALDTMVTPVTFGSATVQVAKSTGHDDGDGYRETRTLIMPGTKASLVLADGSILPMDKLTLRTTEYTVGSNGSKAMPAPIAINTAYTFAAEFSVDEAGNAKTVQFSKPVPVYVDNFLGFPVGTAVPAGWYDREKATWVAANDGVVIKILSITNGIADMDVNGDGIAEQDADLLALGITGDERKTLASQYAVGKELWRMALDHFTAWDFNPSYGAPDDAIGPPVDTYDSVTTFGDTTSRNNDCSVEEGCVISVENGTIGEVVPIAGTPYSLNYNSMDSRGYGRTGNITVRVKNTQKLPATLKRVEVNISYLGRSTTRVFAASAVPDTMQLHWDGKDAFGNFVKGYADYKVTITYVYPEYYLGTGGMARSFAQLASSSSKILSHISRGEVFAKYSSEKRLYVAPGFSGWNLEGMRPWDMNDSVRVLGMEMSLRPYNQRKSSQFVDALDSGFSLVSSSIAFSPGGSLYFRIYQGGGNEPRYVRQKPDGSTTVVLVENYGSGHDIVEGESALSTSGALGILLSYTSSIQVNSDEEMFFINVMASYANVRAVITKVGKDGRLHLINLPCDSGSISCRVSDFTMDSSGTLFAIVSSDNNSIRQQKILRIDHAGNAQLVSMLTNSQIPGAYRYYTGISLDGNGGYFLNFEEGNTGGILAIDALGKQTLLMGEGGGMWYGDIPARGTVLASSIRISGWRVIGKPFKTSYGLVIVDTWYGRAFLLSNGYMHHIAGGGYRDVDSVPINAYDGGLGGYIAVSPEGNLIINNGSKFIQLSPTTPSSAILIDYSYQAGSDGKYYGYDYQHNLVRVVDPLSLKTIRKYDYDSSGYLASVSEFGLSDSGRTTTFVLDTVAGLWNVTAPDGKITRIRFNPASKTIDSVTDAMGGQYAMRYDSLGRILSFTNPNGRRDSIAYDRFGQLSYDGDAFGKGKKLVRIISGDTARNTVTTPEGRTRVYGKVHSANGTVSRFYVSESGDTTFSKNDPFTGRSETRHSDGTREISYTKAMPQLFAGNTYSYMDSLIRPSGLVQVKTRDVQEVNNSGNHQLSDVVTINGKLWTTTTDFLAFTRTTQSPLGRTRIQYLDSSFRVVTDSIPGRHSVHYHYDSLGQVDVIQQAFDTSGVSKTAKVIMTYDLAGNLLSVTDAYGHQSQRGYDALDRVISLSLPDTGAVTFRYDGIGNVIGLTPPGSNEHQFGFDNHDRDTSYLAPTVPGIASTDRKIYDFDELHLKRILPSGDTVKMQREASGRLIGMGIPDAAYNMAYVGKSDKLASMDRASATASSASHLQYVYDGSRLLSESASGATTGSVGWTYNAAGQVSTTTVNGTTFANDYDSDGLLTKVGSLTLSRNAQRGDLDSTSLGTVKSIQILDRAGRLSALRYMSGTTTIREFTYTYNALGKIVAMIDRNGTDTTNWEYKYDIRGRLVAVGKNGITSNTYSYDLNGNRTAKNGVHSSYEAQDRLVSDGTRSYSFDANGSLTSINGALRSSQFHYDALGNLISATLENGTQVGYDIDPRNRRNGKRVNGVKVEGFLYKDQLKPVAWLDGTGAVKATFVYGDRGNVPSYMVIGGVNYRFVTDHLGSVRMVVNATTGAVVQEMDYDEFGVVTRNTAPGFQPFGFAGGLYDEQTKFVRFGARDYDPSVGRWTAKDPIGFEGGFNFFGYVGADPVNRIDPTGENDVDLNKMVQWLDDNASNQPQGKCAKSVRQGLEAGGANTDGRPVDAKDYGPFLEDLGFSEQSTENYDPALGDIVVIQSTSKSESGHIQVWDGKTWVSDFKQNPNSIYPGSTYRKEQPDYSVFRQGSCGCSGK